MYNRRRIDDIILIKEDLIQMIRDEGALLAEARRNAIATNRYLAGVKDADRMEVGNCYADIVDDETKRDRALRIVELAIHEAGDLLYPYTKEVTRRPSYLVSSIYKEPEMWQICLNVPVTMAVSSVQYIKALVMEYAVKRVMAEWTGMYDAERAASVIAEVEQLKERIRAAKDRRTGLVRRRGSVY